MVFDRQGICLYVNSTGISILSYSREELIGRDFRTIWGSGVQALVDEKIKTVLTGCPCDFDADIIAKDGRMLTYNMIFSPLFNGNKEISRFIGIATDITKCKTEKNNAINDKYKLEELLKIRNDEIARLDDVILSQEEKKTETEVRLDEERSRFSTLFEGLPLGIAIADRHGMVVRSNSAYKRLFGSMKNPGGSVTIINSSLSDNIMSKIGSCDDLLSGKANGISLEKQLERGDGSLFWADVSASAVRDSQGRFLYCLVFVNDISGKMQADEELKEKISQFEVYRRFTVGREMKMIELKKQVNALCKELGRQSAHDLSNVEGESL